MSKNIDPYDQPAPPEHLSQEMKDFWLRTFAARRLQPAQIYLFQKACESYDRSETARKVLANEGLTFVDKHGQPRARPEANIEVLSRAQFAKLVADCGIHDVFFQSERKK